MKYRNLGKFLVIAASVSMALSPVSALANDSSTATSDESSTEASSKKRLLNKAITYANDAKADNSYTHVVPKVKAYLEAKLTKANEISKKDNATDTEINAAWSALVDAVHYLDFTGDPTDLDTLVKQHKDKKAEDYKAGWDEFDAALKAAQAALEDRNTLDAELDEKEAALRAAVDGLKAKDPVTTDKTELQAAINSVKDLNKEDYTTDSWAALENALSTANTVNEDPAATQDQVNSAKDDLLKAIDELQEAQSGETVDKTALAAALDAAKTPVETDYTPESWKTFADAKAEAQKVYDKTAATADEVKKATDDLTAAQNALVKKDEPAPEVVDKSALKAALDAAAKVNEADFTTDSWKTFADAKAKAESVYADEKAAQDEVNTASNKLKKAQSNLVRKPVTIVDKSELKKALDAARNFNESKYTEDTWNAFAAAKKAALKVYNTSNANKDDVLEATNNLNQAMKNLVEKTPEIKVNKDKLRQVIDSSKSLAENKPTGDRMLSEDSYEAFKKAYEKAEAVYKDETADQEKVDAAEKALRQAYADLDQTIWRVYNPNNGEHLFTANKEEYDALVKLTWHGEGKAWIAPRLGDEDAQSMVRMYNKNSGEHHYTATANEIKNLEKIGWSNEGAKWASYKDSEKGDRPVVVHRMYNPNAGKNPKTMAGPHHYTLDTHERDELVRIGWIWEHNPEDIFYAKSIAN